MTHAQSSLETGLFLLSKSCTPFTEAENETLKSFNVLSFFQCSKQIDVQLKETGTNSINHQEYLGAGSSKKKKKKNTCWQLGWPAGLVWKFIQSGNGTLKGRAGLGNRKFLPVSSWEWRQVRSQDLQVRVAPAGSCLRCDVTRAGVKKREAGGAPSRCQPGHMEQRAGTCTMLDPNSLLWLGGSSCHFHSGLVLSV